MLIKRKSIELAESSRRPASASADAPKPKRKPKFAPVTLSEQDGVRFLHFGTEWVQGAMRIRKPDWPELEYAQQMMAWMLFIEQPRAIAQLGLGAATLTKFCYRSATCTTPPRAALCSTRPSSTRPATPAWQRMAS
jgi:spermidine synthase